MTIAYNPNSFLDSDTIQVINFIILILLLYGIFSNHVLVESKFLFLSFIIGCCFAAASCKYVLSRTKFYEWDTGERKKKENFFLLYSILCVFFWVTFMFSNYCTFVMYRNLHEFSLVDLIILAPSLFFLFNACNIVSLYFPLFEGFITTARYIQKKPSNWREDGHEISGEEEWDIDLHDFNNKFN